MSENELQLQRLIDGQLDRSQIQQLLAEAQQQPELWQQIASAFVEDQIWKAEIGDRFVETTAAGTVNENEKTLVANITAQPKQTSQSTVVPVKMLLSLAAATLIGLWLGNQFSNNHATNPGEESTVVLIDGENSGTMPDSPRTNNDQLADNRSSVPDDENRVTVFKPVQHLSVGEMGEIPLYTLADAQKMGMTFTDPQFSRELVEEYHQQGYWLQQNTRYVSGRTDGGQRVVVPVRTISLQPGN